MPDEIDQSVIDNFQKYNLAALIEQYRGDIPWALAAATVELESGGDPYIYNYPRGKGNNVGHWTPGTPMPDNGHAYGLFQILQHLTRDHVPAGKTGYDIDYADLFDAEKNIRAGLKTLSVQWGRAKKAPTDALKWALFYVGQNQGGGPLLEALKHLDAGDIKSVVAAAGIAAKVGSVAARVASRVPLWQAVEPKLKGNDGAVAGALAGAATDDVEVLDQDGNVVGYTSAG